MALRFRKSFKVAPGVRLNVSGSGTSVSLGGRGVTTNISKRGTRTSLSIPGTGLSYTSSSRSSSRANQRHLEKAERERRRAEALSKVSVSIDDQGTVSCTDANGDLLKGRELSLAWEQNGEAIRTLMGDAMQKINGDVDLLEGIFQDAPHPSPENLLAIEPFSVREPSKPIRKRYPNEPRLELPREPGLLLGFLGGKKRFEKRVQQLTEEHSRACEQHKEKIARIDDEFATSMEHWKSEHSRWVEARAAHASNAAMAEQEHRIRLSTDQEYAASELEDVLNSLDWPRETLTSFDLNLDKKQVWLDVDLPEIEDLPQRVATIAVSGKKLNVKNKPQKALRLEYANHIHGIALRLACFVSAVLPWADEVVVSGYSQRMDVATGHTNDEYLLSARFTRGRLEQLNFDDLTSIDPVSAVTALEHRRKMTATGVFKAIDPFSPD
ncbi:DUF4236 domain-containing protein [Leisingera sp. NJS204]|uniref:DUF4236 domain-containing protein n=1 Tax=Leisingera sp. NJS204 TaxID=2508307 RepID=UPI0010101A64|nr:DUF4236 domain-containing protein [Leisingera sp. NJS204]QAX28139.1 DUF4236 domain-containing protein [Leisingera sp. NJS204]